MKPAAWGLCLLSLIAAFAASGTAGAAAGTLPDNLADCLRTNSGGWHALPGCEDFFTVLHASPPAIAHDPAPGAYRTVPRPLARPAEDKPRRGSSGTVAASTKALPLARPEAACVLGAANFQAGRSRLERQRGVHFAAEGANRDARIALEVPPHCRIETPLAGEVVFAGSFAGYGGTIILLDARGNHIVLAGFGEIDVTRGEAIGRGAMLGRIASRKPDALIGMFPGAPGALLYLEIRPQTGKADPVEWLAANF